MRKRVILLTILVIIPIFTLSVSASESTDKYLDKFADILPDEYSSITENTDEIYGMVGLDGIISAALSLFSERRGEIFSFASLLLGGVALMGLVGVLPVGLNETCSVGIGAVIAVSTSGVLSGFFSSLGEDIERVCEFFAALIPLFSAVTVAGGGIESAAAHAAAMNTTVAFVSAMLVPLFLGVAGVGVVIGMLSVLDDEIVGNVYGSIKGLFGWMLGIVTAVIMGTLALQTVIGSVKDSAAIRAARYAASGMIPVVGGTVSASLGTLASGLAYVKGVVGVGACAVILSILIAPLALLLLYRLLVSMAATLAECVGVARCKRLYEILRRGFDLFISVYAVAVLLFIFEIILFVMTEAPIG